MDHFYNTHNNTDEPCCDYSSSTLYTLLTFMIFISCYPSIYNILKGCYKDCNDKYKLHKLSIHTVKDSLLLDECSICLEGYIKKDKIVRLNCNHVFHVTCVLPWLKNNNSCPQCRENII